jgi:DNA-binding GntR family transcriptional regulator
MSEGIEPLYRAAIAKMAKSADPEIERLRRSVSGGENIALQPDPQLIAESEGKDPEWGSYAFGELRAFGFVSTDITRFVWYRPTETQIWERQAALAGIEAIAIIRLSSMDCSAAIPEIKDRFLEFEQTASTGKKLASLLDHQKLMLALVAATGETHVLEEYAKRASVAHVYARWAMIEPEDVEGMVGSARSMLELLCSANSRDCAAAAVAMRIHPSEPMLLECAAL